MQKAQRFSMWAPTSLLPHPAERVYIQEPPTEEFLGDLVGNANWRRRIVA
jgi:hypothetical protein